MPVYGRQPVTRRHYTMGRQPGAKGENDEIYRFFRVTDRATGKLKDFGVKGGPSDKAVCLFCEKEQSCQKNRLVVHLAGVKSSKAKPCPGPSRATSDTEEVWDRRTASFRNVRGRMKARVEEEFVLKRKAQEVCLALG